MAANVYPVDGRVAPPAVPIRNTRSPARVVVGASVIGIAPVSVCSTVQGRGPTARSRYRPRAVSYPASSSTARENSVYSTSARSAARGRQ